MDLLIEKIKTDGKLLPGNILKVGSFLNHMIDSDLMAKIGDEISRLYADTGVTKVLTIEASGIAVALAAGMSMHVPMIFAKKHATSNISGDIYTAIVHSYTHGTDYHVAVEADLLNKYDTVLIVDDFLANGQAIKGLVKIVEMSGAKLAGAAVCIEKGFQQGGDELRSMGIRVESLARIKSMSDTEIIFY